MEMDLEGDLPEGLDDVASEVASAAVTPCTLEPRVMDFVKLVRIHSISRAVLCRICACAMPGVDL
jgi:hypothetical protein